ncbi:lipid-A-disaccharide synthase [Acinetobacter populi]|uniref:Lipid-A-disaccharide synthase n=1 Tax=Acinetobacter populi TaxID=1582270 RepID=A0A1Z9YXV1_9GAMM|nr:lipid-A-disaccharide synthase [Acinetobacter populi]OUY07044.1 lipid-A-disaccharide synthase [Acinetobacter populi]
MSKRLKIAIVVGEVSGDTLGAALIRSFKAQGIDADFEGIGGPQMIAEGFKSLYPMDTLSVMGLVEVLKHLKDLFAVRDGLIQHWENAPIDLYIGIDAPDFNLRVAKLIKDKKLPIKTVQYVSPSVWAWRQKRVFNIKYAIDLVLCLFPFEVDFYQKYDVPAVFVGHPLAKQLPLNPDAQQAKQQLQLDPAQAYIALLPGSRSGEVSKLLPVMLESVQRMMQSQPQLKFLIPAINAQRSQQIKTLLATQPDTVQEKIHVIDNTHTSSNIGRLVMQASDAVVLASGTATLEALLLHKPMVVIYKLHWLTYRIMLWMVKIPDYSLPNIIAKKKIVTELIQSDATAQNIERDLTRLLNTEQGLLQQQQLLALHEMLISDQSIQDPAQAILQHFHLV